MTFSERTTWLAVGGLRGAARAQDHGLPLRSRGRLSVFRVDLLSARTDAHAAEFPSQVPSQVPSQLPSLTPIPQYITNNGI